MRLALAFVVIVGALGWPAELAVAETSSNVLVTATVYTASGTSTDSVTVAALEANPGQCPTYQEQSMNEQGRQGFVDVQLPQNATWSLPTILGCLPTPIPPGAIKGVTVIASNGTPEEGSGSAITARDLASPSDFDNTSEYPVFEALGSLNQYDRPWRGNAGGQPDYDFFDEVQGTQDDQPTPIAIEVFEGGVLTVTVNASRTTVPAGGTVAFSATVSGGNGSPLSYSWSFDGAAPNSTAAAPSVTFGAAGQYDVTLQVTDTGGDGGGTEIPITVGSLPPAATGTHKQSGSGTSRKSHSPTGPRRSSGNHAGSSPGTHKTQSTTAGKNNTTTSTTSHTSTTPSSAATTPSSTRPATTPTTPAHTSGSRRRTPRRPAPVIKAPAPAPLSGPLVIGQLISDITPLPAGASPLVRTVPAPQPSAPPARQAIRASALPAVASGLAVALLLGLGAARELRGRRDRRGRRGWRSWRAVRGGH